MDRITRRSFTTYGVSGTLSMPFLANLAQAAPAATNQAFKLGLVTYNLGAKFDVPTLIRVCKATGIGPVELRTTHMREKYLEVEKFPEAKLVIKDLDIKSGAKVPFKGNLTLHGVTKELTGEASVEHRMA